MKTIGERLRYARERKNLKQKQVMEITGGRINNKTLSGYEDGVSEPDIETLKILSDLYEVSIDWLSGNDHVIREARSNYTIDPKKKVLIDEIDKLSEEDAEYILGLIRRIKKN